MEFRRGVPVAPLRVAWDRRDRRGTEVHFMASAETFRNIEFHYDILAKRLRELSFLNNGVKIELIDQRNGKERELRLRRRRQGLRRVHERSKTVLHPNVFHAVGEKDGSRSRRGGDAVERLATARACCASPTTSRSATAART